MDNNYLIIGDLEEQISFYINDILAKIEHKDEDIINYNLQADSIKDILDEASMPSLFSKTKIIIATNLDITKIDNDNQEYLKSYLKNKHNDIYIILIAKKVDARLSVYKIFKESFKIIDIAKTNNEEDIISYTKSLINKSGYKISPDTLEYLITKTGNDIYNINNELNKLFTYKEEDKTITPLDIDKLIPDSIDAIIYEFTNAFFDDNPTDIIKMYNDFKLSGVTFDYLLISLANSIRQALIIKLLNSEKKSNLEISKIIGKKEFYVKKMLERIYPYSTDTLAKYLIRLADIDNNYKSGKTNYDELEMFIITKE